MRFLCLHGMGTNSKIFELQTAKIRHALEPGNEFVFVNGTVPWDPAPKVKEIFPEEKEFLRYALEQNVASALQCYTDLKAFITTEGPFDGICGFSEGAGIAAGLLAAQFKDPYSLFKFKCGIFFSAGPAIDMLALEQGEIRVLDLATDGKFLKLPTAHIWDPEDTVHPGFGRSVKEICDIEMMEEVQHSLGHEVPGRGSSHAVAECTRSIDRTIERANVR
ncbi:hypothetical protein DM02DRAFT_671166 [Periconia macrospinosa]|uniref:Serine hydrolase domain-containing protein n=1 Tax=Periconia macrospinosa TaxID=97972 RepID=A0A2V1DTT5_9PLEO|nr:hypothetical protein DM02DRAFT_671166 [Periconia macrospinosa]